MNKIAKLSAVLKVPSYRKVFLRYRVAAAVEHTAVLGSLDLRTVVDVGANRGQFSLFALNNYPTARVIAFEPLSAPADRFNQVLGGVPRVTLHRSALGASPSESDMHVSGHDDSSSLLPITSTQTELFRGTDEVRMETVRVARLTDILSESDVISPAMLKLDVQGYELEVLQGCEELLGAFDYVCAEGSFIELYEGQALAGQLIAWLSDHQFDLVCVYGTTSDRGGRAVQADMLFRRSRSAT